MVGSASARGFLNRSPHSSSAPVAEFAAWTRGSTRTSSELSRLKSCPSQLPQIEIGGSRMFSVAMSVQPQVTFSQPELLFDQPYSFGPAITFANYDVAPDGQRFLMIRNESNSGRLNVVLNWAEELKRLVPAN